MAGGQGDEAGPLCWDAAPGKVQLSNCWGAIRKRSTGFCCLHLGSVAACQNLGDSTFFVVFREQWPAGHASPSHLLVDPKGPRPVMGSFQAGLGVEGLEGLEATARGAGVGACVRRVVRRARSCLREAAARAGQDRSPPLSLVLAPSTFIQAYWRGCDCCGRCSTRRSRWPSRRSRRCCKWA